MLIEYGNIRVQRVFTQISVLTQNSPCLVKSRGKYMQQEVIFLLRLNN